jgi:hypothetical protein
MIGKLFRGEGTSKAISEFKGGYHSFWRNRYTQIIWSQYEMTVKGNPKLQWKRKGYYFDVVVGKQNLWATRYDEHWIEVYDLS